MVPKTCWVVAWLIHTSALVTIEANLPTRLARRLTAGVGRAQAGLREIERHCGTASLLLSERRAERPPYICSRLLAHHSDSSFLGPPYHVGRAAPTGKRQHQIGLAFLQHLLVALGSARTTKVHQVRILRGFNSALAG